MRTEEPLRPRGLNQSLRHREGIPEAPHLSATAEGIVKHPKTQHKRPNVITTLFIKNCFKKYSEIYKTQRATALIK